MAPPAKKNVKPVFKTAIPFTETHWPKVTSTEQDVILDLACDLLQPLGGHRKTHVQPSKGKKRKRQLVPKPASNDQDAIGDANDVQDAPPPVPEIGNHILVGLNSVTRHLEVIAAQKKPSTMLGAEKEEHVQPAENREHSKPQNGGQDRLESKENNSIPTKDANVPQPLSILIIPHPHPPISPAHHHLPTLVHLSALTSPKPLQSPVSASEPISTIPATPNTATRLLALSPISESRLAAALHIPRVGALGILEGAPGAGPLVEYVRQNIAVTKCKWIDEAMRAEWKGLKVDVHAPKT